jgi:hypothetical protein
LLLFFRDCSSHSPPCLFHSSQMFAKILSFFSPMSSPPPPTIVPIQNKEKALEPRSSSSSSASSGSSVSSSSELTQTSSTESGKMAHVVSTDEGVIFVLGESRTVFVGSIRQNWSMTEAHLTNKVA